MTRYSGIILFLGFFTALFPHYVMAETHKPDMFENDVLRRSEELNATPAPAPVKPSDDTAPNKTFMESYCDPAFVPILSNNVKYFGQEGCLKAVRDNVCARFKALPPDVQSVLDDSIGCLFANGNGYAVDKNQKVSNESIACGRGYMLRIETLKKYYYDYYAQNALIFMPDDVMDTSGRCANRK